MIFFHSGSCIRKQGNVSGGGALELVADKGEIIIGNKLAILFNKQYLKFVKSCNYTVIKISQSKNLINSYLYVLSMIRQCSQVSARYVEFAICYSVDLVDLTPTWQSYSLAKNHSPMPGQITWLFQKNWTMSLFFFHLSS